MLFLAGQKNQALLTISTWVRCTATGPFLGQLAEENESCWTNFVKLFKFELGETKDERLQLLG